jgi:D-xylose 1-dehydrogenase
MEPTLYPSLAGKVVLITGGASGIGADLVRGFVRQNCTVVFLDIQDKLGQHLAESLGERAHYRRCDLACVNEIRAVVPALLKEFGPVSVLLNNAANDQRQTVESVDTDDWDWSQHTNLRSQFFVAQACYTAMQSLGCGSIINMSSIAWRIGVQDLTAYSTAKAGILGLTHSLALEFGKHRIRVNAIEPGAVMTEKQRKLWYPNEADVARMTSRQLTPDVLLPDDIVRVALFLASSESVGITGQSIRVDAGFR